MHRHVGSIGRLLAAAVLVMGLVASAGCGSGGSSGGGAPGGGAPGGGITILGQNIKFQPSEVSAPANTPVRITFMNRDLGVPHNLHVKDASGNTIAKTPIITGLATADLVLPAMAPGTYPFVCDVHPNMTGTLTVGP
jgi:plastocyanin